MHIVSVKMGAEGDLRRVELSDGAVFLLRMCYLSPALADEGLFDMGSFGAMGDAEGRELGEGDLEGLRFAAACFRAEKAALQLVARAEQTAWGLQRKLGKRRHDSDCAGAAIARLCELGLLDDGRYARLWLESRISRQAASPMRLLASLRAKGIGRDDAEEALRKALDAEAELQLLERFLQKQRHRLGRKGMEEGSDAERRALKYMLKSEGFSSLAIEQFFDE